MEARGGSALRQGGGGEDNEQHNTTIRWKPNEQCLELLLAMGIDRNAAIKVRKVLFLTLVRQKTHQFYIFSDGYCRN